MRTLNEFDVKMFFVMDAMKTLSKCRDKQVVCIIVDSDNDIQSVGVNTVYSCNNACEDKAHRICDVTHAERVAIENATWSVGMGPPLRLRAYVNLFPCGPCQDALDPFVDEIVTFGMAHKEWKSNKVTLFPHPFYQHKDKQPTKTEEQRDVSKMLLASSMYVIGDMSSTIQDQYPYFREELSKQAYRLVRDNIEKRFGLARLTAITKETYKPE